jgi:putative ABC transport system permease protein
VLDGKQRTVRVVGIVRSPEYVFSINVGELAPDPARFGVLYMTRKALDHTFRMQGAFNDVALTLAPGVEARAVVDELDRMLDRYGGTGAYLQDKQASNYALNGELEQLRGMSTVLPIIFVLVAALLVNVVMSRLVHLQRPEIAALKALGYGDAAIGGHFLQFVLWIVGFGTVVGVGVGAYLCRRMLLMYARYFKLPQLELSLSASGLLLTVAFCGACAVAGAMQAVLAATRLPPAEAMRPPAPAHYRRTFLDRTRLGVWFGPGIQMVLRELEQKPWRPLLSAIAIASSIGLMVIGAWYYDSIEHLMRTQFHQAMREDWMVAFTQARPAGAIAELAHLPGVLQAEGLRTLPVRFRVGHHTRDAMLFGYPHDSELRRLRDGSARLAPLPPDGVVLTDVLADRLGVKLGETVGIESHEGQRLKRSIVVSGLVSEAFGQQGHMDLAALERLFGEQNQRSLALLRVDPAFTETLQTRLKDLPYVGGVTGRVDILEHFKAQSGAMIITVSLIIMLFAATITVGVVYNNARIALSTRARDLASLRVLGFTRAEISSVLLTEMSIPVLLAIVPGFFLGHWFVLLLAGTVDPETYRLPIVIEPRAYAASALVALLASACSALLVRRRLDQLDLIGVLKTRE